jgi:uncharacterized protein (TIGR02421 family)
MAQKIPHSIAAEQELYQLQQSLDTNIIKFVNPQNAIQEQQTFFQHLEQGKEYNPRFEYLSNNPLYSYFALSPDSKELEQKIQKVETDQSTMGKLLEKKKHDLLNEVNLIRTIGKQEFTETNLAHFGKPDKKLVGIAEEILDKKSKLHKKNKSAASLKAYLEDYIKNHGMKMKVELSSDMTADASMSSHSGVLLLRENARFSENDFQRLLVHEIQTHYFRYLNGTKQKSPFFSTGFSNQWLTTEEGLAVVNEEYFGLLDDSTLKKYAGRVLAVNYALDHSFYETFDYLQQHFSPEQAYSITQRVKRGMTKTEHAGAFTKDFVYLQGRVLVKEFLENGGSFTDLYYGKISVDETPLLANLDLEKPAYAPSY